MWRLIVIYHIYFLHFRTVIRTIRKRGAFPNAVYPKNIAEKYLWRKIFDHNPEFELVCDKLQSKKIAKLRCPEVDVAEILWIGTKASEISADLWEQEVILKTNHGSSQMVFLNDDALDKLEVESLANKWISRPYGKKNGEWAYWSVDRKLFVEQIVKPSEGQPFEDYNTHLVNGKVVYTQCYRDKLTANKHNALYDREGNLLEHEPCEPSPHVDIPPSKHYAKIVEMAEKIGADYDHIRCDFFVSGDKIYFCELTVYPSAGYDWITGKRLKKIWEEAWDINESWFAKQNHTGWRLDYINALKNMHN